MPSKLRDERLLKFAREMRKNRMPEERKLWYMDLQKHHHIMIEYLQKTD